MTWIPWPKCFPAGSLDFSSDLLTIAGIVFVMARFNLKLTLIAFVTAPIILVTLLALWAETPPCLQGSPAAGRRNSMPKWRRGVAGMRVIQALSQEEAARRSSPG